MLTALVPYITSQYDFNLLYAKALVQDLDERQMTEVPAAGLLNHPAFTLGHLVTGSGMMAEDLGGKYIIPGGWKELFQRRGPNDQARPEADRAKYPAKKALLEELERQHENVKTLLADCSDRMLEQNIVWRFGVYLPTLLDLTIYMCLTHEAMHLGQLAAWRRAMGLPPMLGTL